MILSLIFRQVPPRRNGIESALQQREDKLVMLRITTKQAPGSLTLVLEGRLCGAWTEEAENAWSRLMTSADGEQLSIDLAGVTFVDHAGESWLASVLGKGAKVRASGLLISHIVREVERKIPG